MSVIELKHSVTQETDREGGEGWALEYKSVDCTPTHTYTGLILEKREGFTRGWMGTHPEEKTVGRRENPININVHEGSTAFKAEGKN